MASQDSTPQTPPPAPPPDREVVTRHEARIGGRPLAYRATAGTLTLHAEDKEKGTRPTGSVFYVAYQVEGPAGPDGPPATAQADDPPGAATDPAARPLTFAFNGGPGSSSAWLHLGLLGPRRVDVGDALAPPPPPYALRDNALSLLDQTDLVFVDPISTGYSRAVPGEDAVQFHGLREDAEAVAEFIRLFTTRARRWRSPKVLMGESYGTTRAAALAGLLQDRHGLYLNGVALISTVLLFGTARPDTGNDLPFVLVLPAYAATAAYHGASPEAGRDPDSLAAEVEDFALGDYATVLLQGSRAPEARRRAVARRLARYTGLPLAFVEQADLRVSPRRFFKTLLRDRRRTVGRLDARFLGIDPDAAGEHAEYDPSYSLIQAPFTAAVNDYLRADLGFETDTLYEVLNPDRVRPWRLGDPADPRYVDVASSLRDAMSRNRGLRLFLAGGYYDLATPYLAAEWSVDQMRLDPSLRGNVTTARYPAGHMMYVHPPSFERLVADLRAFLAAATRPS